MVHILDSQIHPGIEYRLRFRVFYIKASSKNTIRLTEKSSSMLDVPYHMQAIFSDARSLSLSISLHPSSNCHRFFHAYTRVTLHHVNRKVLGFADCPRIVEFLVLKDTLGLYESNRAMIIMILFSETSPLNRYNRMIDTHRSDSRRSGCKNTRQPCSFHLRDSAE